MKPKVLKHAYFTLNDGKYLYLFKLATSHFAFLKTMTDGKGQIWKLVYFIIKIVLLYQTTLFLKKSLIKQAL